MDSLGQKVTLPIRLETRGKTRLVRCDIPPILIYFDKPALEEQKFKDYPKLKVGILRIFYPLFLLKVIKNLEKERTPKNSIITI